MTDPIGGLVLVLLGDDPDAPPLVVEHGHAGLGGEEGVDLGQLLVRHGHLHGARHDVPEPRRGAHLPTNSIRVSIGGGIERKKKGQQIQGN